MSGANERIFDLHGLLRFGGPALMRDRTGARVLAAVADETFMSAWSMRRAGQVAGGAR